MRGQVPLADAVAHQLAWYATVFNPCFMGSGCVGLDGCHQWVADLITPEYQYLHEYLMSPVWCDKYWVVFGSFLPSYLCFCTCVLFTFSVSNKIFFYIKLFDPILSSIAFLCFYYFLQWN